MCALYFLKAAHNYNYPPCFAAQNKSGLALNPYPGNCRD